MRTNRRGKARSAACLGVLLAAALSSCGTAFAEPAEGPLAEEIRLAHQWAEAAVAASRARAKRPPAAAPAETLVVVRKSHKVLAGHTVWNTPLKLAEKVYDHGIFMDAPAAVRVRLGRPAAALTAVVGIDNNDSTRSNPNAGSARFHVLVEGNRVFSTPVLRLRDKPVHVDVPLHGAKQFVLEVDDGGDGRGWDQCTWADAAVKLKDGSTLRLDRLPLGTRRTRGTAAPFSFTYGGVPSDKLLPGWDRSEREEAIDHGRRRVISLKCPRTGLRIDWQVTTYDDAAAVDWVFYLRNEGPAYTPILDGFLPLDATLLDVAPARPLVLRWSNGDCCGPESFFPHDEPLVAGRPRQFAPFGGRSSNGAGGGALPFFNCRGPRGGWVLAVGWSGQWAAEFVREADGRLTAGAGMETTHFRLRPGQRVRTPRIVLLRYLGGEMIRGHNRFRQLMLKHYVPRHDGRPLVPPVCHNTAATVYRSGEEATEANQLAILRAAAALGCEAYWMDAYWYPRPWSTNVGNWYPRPDDFPRGLRPLGDAAHQVGMKFVLWFEPERVAPGTRFDREHGEMLLTLDEHGNRLFNLADPGARRFLADFLDERIKAWGVDLYRNDFNIDPLPYWQKNDPPDRQGVTEMLYVEGLYQLWSELIRRNPGLAIDNCASGGRRIDLETCSLSYPLWRSDRNDIGEGLKGPAYWPRMALADQNMVLGLALYLPFQSGPLWDMHPYSFRSAMTSSVVLYERILHDEFPRELAKQGIAELKALRPLFLGDVYPLTEPSIDQAAWCAYQLDRADLGEGCVFVFRRPECKQSTFEVRLHNIDADAIYRVSTAGETYAAAEPGEMIGRELAHRTLTVDVQPGSALLRYKRTAP